jgi:glutaredoxin-related protein
MSNPAVTDRVARRLGEFQPEVLAQVTHAVETHDVVVVGMAWNPHVPKARKALAEAGIEYTYIGYGNYLWGWKKRLAVKLWSGWPTFPQVFVKGTLVGGDTSLRLALADGTVGELLGAPDAN